MFCYTDKKENKIFLLNLIYGNSEGSGAKSYMTNGLLIYICVFPHILIRKPFLIYDFAPDPIWISIYIRKVLFSFLSVYHKVWSASTSYLDFIYDIIEEPAHWLYRKWGQKTRKCGENLTMTLGLKFARLRKQTGKSAMTKNFQKTWKPISKSWSTVRVVIFRGNIQRKRICRTNCFYGSDPSIHESSIADSKNYFPQVSAIFVDLPASTVPMSQWHRRI